jgi:hypothetical protein
VERSGGKVTDLGVREVLTARLREFHREKARVNDWRNDTTCLCAQNTAWNATKPPAPASLVGRS